MVGDHGIRSAGVDGQTPRQRDLGVGVVLESIDRDHHWDSERTRVRDQPHHIAATLFEQLEIFLRVRMRERLAGHDFRTATVHLQSADGRHQHRAVGVLSLDVEGGQNRFRE